MKDKIENLIKDALVKLGAPDAEFSVEHPEDLKNGDYSTNVAMVCWKKFETNELKPSRVQVADMIGGVIKKNLPNEIEKIEVAGGFINFYLSESFFSESLTEIFKLGENFGKSNLKVGKKVLVEYSSPNIAKPFTIGHLRSTIIGDSISRILEFSGFEVTRDNHLGDWGTQFGKLIVAIKKWGNFEALENDPEPIKTLVDLYVKFYEEAEKDTTLKEEGRKWFAKLENKDEEAMIIWHKCIDLSMKEFNKVYDRLSVSKFDTVLGESFFENKMKDVINDVKAKNLGKESQGAFIIEFSEEKKLPPLLLFKSDGSSLYALRDLATDKWRKYQYGNDITIINEVGSEQREYFR